MTLTSPLFAATPARSFLPDEIYTTGGEGTAMADSGAALISDQSAIHINPAMLYRHKTYDVSGSYIWPIEGRPFYRAAAIDGSTSKWTTAFEYTGFSDALQPRESREIDSPVRRRGSLAFSIPTNLLALGFSGNYVEAEDPTRDSAQTIKGFTLGTGLVAQIAANLRFGASVQNLNNEKLKNVSPRTVRAGFAWDAPSGALALFADYRDRERSQYLEGQPLTAEGTVALADLAVPSNLPHEKMAIFGGQAQTMDIVRVFIASGRNIGGERKDVTSGGIGIFQKNFSLAYAVSRNYPDAKDLQSSVHLSITMKM